jgi:hypothetical protein
MARAPERPLRVSWAKEIPMMVEHPRTGLSRAGGAP